MRTVLLTGGNLGDVRGSLGRARELIQQRIGPVVQRSSERESAPWGFTAEQPFWNQALVCETELTPEQVLDAVQQIENELGRIRQTTPESGPGENPAPPAASVFADPADPGRRYESRTIDIDILFYGRETIHTPRLTVPHPLIGQRDFVLRLLDEIMPLETHPQSGFTIHEMLENHEKESHTGAACGHDVAAGVVL